MAYKPCFFVPQVLLPLLAYCASRYNGFAFDFITMDSLPQVSVGDFRRHDDVKLATWIYDSPRFINENPSTSATPAAPDVKGWQFSEFSSGHGSSATAAMAYKPCFFVPQRDNVYMDDNVLQACRKTGVRKLVSSLSNCIFPAKATYPINEHMIHDGPPSVCHTGFAYARRLLDIKSRMYHSKHNCQFVSVIPANVFGPHGNFSPEGGHVIPSLIAKTYDAKASGKPLEILGTGRALRQFIYSADVARLIVWVLREYEEPDPIILSVDESDEISILELVQVITRIIGYQGNVVFDATKTDGQLKKTLSNDKMRRLLPTFQFTPFEEAVRETADWYERNRNTARS
ncbi:GDP-L-fucose synthase [Ixodes scapularis]